MEAAVLYHRIVSRLALVLFLAVCARSMAQEVVIPVGASSPHVFLSLTDEQDPQEQFFSIPSSSTRSEGLPIGGQDVYQVVIYDTGSPTTIISREVFERFDIAGIDRDGTNITPVGGVGETVDAINSDPLGVYVAGFDSLLTNPRTGESIVDRTRLKGSFNDPVLYGSLGTSLPNVVGTNTSMNYATQINYSDPQIVEYDGETYRSPSVQLVDFGSITPPDRRIGLKLEPGQLGSTSGAFLPDLAGIGGGGELTDNPSTPSIGGSFWLTANISNNGVSRNQVEAILDTGAQASIVSDQMAAQLGFDVINDKPDFVVHIQGVTGISEEVPGFFADEFHLPGTDGGLRLNNVPLIVFNLTDPRDGINTLDALIGMNVFAGRDIILNPELGSPYVGISDPLLSVHTWEATTLTADWNSSGSWQAPGVPAIDWYASVRNTKNAPLVAVVNSDSTVGDIVLAGNENEPDATMAISVQQGSQLTVFGTAFVQEGGVLEVIDGEIDSFAVELRGGTLSGSGVVAGEISSQGNVIPGGEGEIGKFTFSGNVDLLSNSKLNVELGDNSDRSNLQFDKLDVEGIQMTLDGILAISSTDDYVQLGPGESDFFSIVEASQILGEFAEYSFNGKLLEREFPVSSDRRSFRDHVGDGQFITVAYMDTTSVAIRNDQALLGDTDGDGEVQFADFVVLADNFDGEADWTGGDFNGDGLVQFNDFLALANNFGRIAGNQGAALAAVPEPSTALLALIGLGLTFSTA